MKKILIIAWKDLRLTLRDPGALLVMLVAPLALTLAIAFAFGTGGSSGIQKIEVALVNHDSGKVGTYLVEAYQADELSDLLNPVVLQDEQEARKLVEQGNAAAAVIIPADFSNAIFRNSVQSKTNVDIFSDPARPIGAAVIQTITEQILARMNSARASGIVSVTGLVQNGLISVEKAPALAEEISQRAAANEQLSSITLDSETRSAGSQGFDWLAYSAPSMAILFLMFAVSNGGRSILAEREGGTLTRMLVTPSTSAQVLGGKVVGIFLTGLAQMLILFLASRLLFNLGWGEPLAVLILTICLCAAATGWGVLIAAAVRTPGQAGMASTAVTLIFAAVAGNFFPRSQLPKALQIGSLISPNAWGLEGFSRLMSGGKVADITASLLALIAMALILFGLASILFRRQYSH